MSSVKRCEGCGGPPIFLADLRLPTDEVVRVCGTCMRKAAQLDASSVTRSDPRHELHVLREMPAPTRTRQVVPGVPLVLELDIRKMGGGTVVDRILGYEPVVYRVRDRNERGWNRLRASQPFSKRPKDEPDPAR